jgi:AMMECR1 domain-containing protein
MCLALIKEPVDGDPSHEDQMDQLRRLFPKARKWFDWWTMADVEAMLFQTRRARSCHELNQKMHQKANGPRH